MFPQQSFGGLVHRWSFNEGAGTNLFDSAAGVTNASIVVLSLVDYQWGAGYVRMGGGSSSWNLSDYLNMPSGLVSGLTNVTIEVWATPRQFRTWSRVFDFGPAQGGGAANDFYLSFCRDASLNQQRLEHDPAPQWRIETALSTTASNQYHYVVTWSKTGGPNGGGLAAWYRDGVLAGSTDTGTRSVANVNDTTLWLGRSHFTSDQAAFADYNEFRIYSHAMSSNEVNFSRLNGPDTYVTPPNQASGLNMSTNANVLVLTWTPGAGSAGSVVVMRAGQPVSMQPNYGTNYTGSAVFGSGSHLGGSNYVVYAGSGTNVTVTNLLGGQTYYATVYSYTGSGASTIYNLADAPSASRAAPGVVQSISLSTPSPLVFTGSGQASVFASYLSGVVANVSSNATYTSSASNIVTVSTSGLLTGVGVGNATITATYQGFQSSNVVTVVNPLTENLRHRYPFTTNANDVLDGADGTLQGGATIANGQVLFNGSTAHVLFPAGLVAANTTITLEAWVTNTVSSTWSRILDFGSGTTVNMFLTPRGGSGVLRFALTIGGGGAEQQINGTAPLPTNVEKHVVVTLNGNVGILYVDGLAVGSNTVMTLNPSSMGETTQNYLGRSQYDPPDPYFSGSMNEFRIYDVALPPGLVLSNYLNGPNALPITPPQVVNDYATLNPAAKVLIPVLANDTGPRGDPATLEIVNPPSNGSAIVKPDGKVLYTHNGSATTSDLFTYRVQGVSGATSSVASVWLTIDDSLRLAGTTLALPADPPPTVFKLDDALPGVTFTQPICLATVPGNTNRLFVCERLAKIYLVPSVTASSPSKQLFLDLQQVIMGRTPNETIEGGGNNEHGLLGLAFHPGFATNDYFYVAYTVRINGGSYYQRISRFKVSAGDPNVADPNSELILLQQLDEGSNHDGGDLHFGPDNYLYYAAGDEENPNDFRLNSQLINKDFFAGIFRIDVDKRPGNLEPNPHAAIPTNSSGAHFSVPMDNPFVYTSLGGTWDGTYNGITNVSSGADPNLATIRMEFWATGLRHVWRMSFDSLTGDLWAGDVGQDTYEEVDFIVKGGNYGWVHREGTNNTGLRNPVPAGFTSIDPIIVYTHAGIAGGDPLFKGNSVCGGVVYRGAGIPELYGHYIFCDSVSGHVWARDPNSGVVTRITGVPAAYGGLVSMGVDPSNQDVLFCDYINGRILRLAAGTIDTEFPQTLSDTGAFADVAALEPNPGLLNYDPIVAFWSDNAIKRRWFTQTDLSSNITHVVDGNWVFPPGMVWVKHFDFELEPGNPASKKRLEIRFIVQSTNGVYGVSYAWNDAGTEAYLVPDGGTNFNLVITNGMTTVTQQWGIPSRSECLACHTDVAGRALSFNTRQLNQTGTINGIHGNQLATLSAAGYFANPVVAPQTLPAFAHATNTDVSLEYRARSYFSVNCVQCHQSGGSGPPTWDARAWLSLEGTGLINGEPFNNGANSTNKLIVPGDTAHSVVLQRILGNGFSRMPPLATAVIDQGASNLLAQWISTELTNHLSFADWQLANFGSTNSPDSLATADPDGDKANNYYEWLTKTPPLTNAPPPWSIVSINENSSTVSVSFLRIANLGFVVETSNPLGNWVPWDVPDNQLWFSASTFVDTVTGPLIPGETNRYFRVRIVQP